jgi:hypothetical protein
LEQVKRWAVVLTAVLLISCNPPQEPAAPAPAAAAAKGPTREEVRALTKKIQNGERLTDSEAALLSVGSNDSNPVIAELSTMALAVAAHEGLTPRKEVLALIEARASRKKGDGGELYGNHFRLAAGAQASADALMRGRWDDRKARPFDPRALSREDKLFISTVEKDPRSAYLAGQLFLRKESLRGEDLSYALDYVKKRKSSTTGGDLLYWEFVERVLQAKAQ